MMAAVAVSINATFRVRFFKIAPPKNDVGRLFLGRATNPCPRRLVGGFMAVWENPPEEAEPRLLAPAVLGASTGQFSLLLPDVAPHGQAQVDHE